ncbi:MULTISPECIES: phage tail assembly protein [Cloacibacillus]|uniref:phage tail assembly protein n=1 Tax=Cloacibacillus TaxID=508459 RepID=UPI0023F30C37|nr:MULTISPECIES: phage tail assembly protein [Cloacibacillus]MDD7649262.1 phage tail assembly protein [Cloacibacillus porcorum]MDY4093583.1 phage tail assembly protein [Cloacibacillus porcorum]
MNNKTIQLKCPITIAGKVISELVVQEPKAKHLRGLKIGFDGIEMEMVLELAGTLTGQLPAVIDELSIEDMAELGRTVIDFLPSGLIPAGKQASAT